LYEWRIREFDRRSGIDDGDSLLMSNELAQLGGIDKVASRFGKTLSVILSSSSVDGCFLKNSGPSDPGSGEFSSALVQGRQEHHCIDRTKNSVGAVSPVMSVNLTEVLIGEDHAHFSPSPNT